MINIKDLLKQYADTCKALASPSVYSLMSEITLEAKELAERKTSLESQTIKLFEEAKGEGARVERAECIKLVSNKWHEISDRFTNSVAANQAGYHIVNAIRERGNQSEQSGE